MKAGDKVRCVSAGDIGIPLVEGKTYTVRRYGTYRQLTGEAPELKDIKDKAVVVVEDDGIYMESRFELIEEEEQ
jgi:hypothetical protein